MDQKHQEIHYDRIGGRDASNLVNADSPDVIEIWNNVFIQYNREQENGSLHPLPARHVDTGMGLERLTSILQGVDSNYDTDMFIPLFDAIQNVIGAKIPYSGKVGVKEDPEYTDMAYRVVADHIRTLCFAIADGAVPSNKGRGYVLRRILRRAMYFWKENLGAKEKDVCFLANLVPTVVQLMGDTFPELVEKQKHIMTTIREEEEKFSTALEKGEKHFKKLAEKVGSDGVLSGEDAFKLFDRHGFPVDLTEIMAEKQGLKVDKEGFELRMEEHRALSRGNGKIKYTERSKD